MLSRSPKVVTRGDPLGVPWPDWKAIEEASKVSTGEVMPKKLSDRQPRIGDTEFIMPNESEKPGGDSSQDSSFGIQATTSTQSSPMPQTFTGSGNQPLTLPPIEWMSRATAVYGIWLSRPPVFWRDGNGVIFHTPHRAVAIAQLQFVREFNSLAEVREIEEQA